MERQPNQPPSEMDKINYKNDLAVDMIEKNDIDRAFKQLKECENFLLTTNTRINKKVLILILHNLAFCYQQTNEFDNCVEYLDAVLFNYDELLKAKYKVNFDINYFKTVNNASENLCVDLILQIRYSAKFHLQLCAVLSQTNEHEEAMRHAVTAAYMCEDNILKTYYLYYQVMEEITSKLNDSNEEENEYTDLKNELSKMKKVVDYLHKQVTEIRSFKLKSAKKSFE
jgi:cell division protein FtsL